MAWFAVYRTSDGELISTGTAVASAEKLAARGYAFIEIGFQPPLPGKQWDKAARNFVDVAVPLGNIPLFDFWMRFTQQEREALSDAARNDNRPAVRKRLRAFLDVMQTLQTVPLDAPFVRDELNAAETVNLIGAGRAAQILRG